jgi:hypothetical protein
MPPAPLDRHLFLLEMPEGIRRDADAILPKEQTADEDYEHDLGHVLSAYGNPVEIPKTGFLRNRRRYQQWPPKPAGIDPHKKIIIVPDYRCLGKLAILAPGCHCRRIFSGNPPHGFLSPRRWYGLES